MEKFSMVRKVTPYKEKWLLGSQAPRKGAISLIGTWAVKRMVGRLHQTVVPMFTSLVVPVEVTLHNLISALCRPTAS
jgi:hypothetical protein